APTALAAGAETQKPEGRGSDKMMQDLLGMKPVLDTAELRKLVAAVTRHGKVIDWCQYGQPGIDGVCGNVLVGPKAAGGLMVDLFSLEHIRPHLDVFPYGIPVIEQLLIRLRAGKVPGG